MGTRPPCGSIASWVGSLWIDKPVGAFDAGPTNDSGAGNFLIVDTK